MVHVFGGKCALSEMTPWHCAFLEPKSVRLALVAHFDGRRFVRGKTWAEYAWRQVLRHNAKQEH